MVRLSATTVTPDDLGCEQPSRKDIAPNPGHAADAFDHSPGGDFTNPDAEVITDPPPTQPEPEMPTPEPAKPSESAEYECDCRGKCWNVEINLSQGQPPAPTDLDSALQNAVYFLRQRRLAEKNLTVAHAAEKAALDLVDHFEIEETGTHIKDRLWDNRDVAAVRNYTISPDGMATPDLPWPDATAPEPPRPDPVQPEPPALDPATLPNLPAIELDELSVATLTDYGLSKSTCNSLVAKGYDVMSKLIAQGQTKDGYTDIPGVGTMRAVKIHAAVKKFLEAQQNGTPIPDVTTEPSEGPAPGPTPEPTTEPDPPSDTEPAAESVDEPVDTEPSDNTDWNAYFDKSD